jgi:hypothetical protein
MQGGGIQYSPSGGTAKSLILVGLFLQALLVLIAFAVGFFLLIVLVGVLFLLAACFGLIWVLLVYMFSYRPTSDGDYERARTPTIVFAVLSLLTLSLIPGILYLIAYVKLGDATRDVRSFQTSMPGAPGSMSNPYLSPPAALNSSRVQVCLKCGSVRQGAAAFCPHCGTAWPP